MPHHFHHSHKQPVASLLALHRQAGDDSIGQTLLRLAKLATSAHQHEKAFALRDAWVRGDGNDLQNFKAGDLTRDLALDSDSPETRDSAVSFQVRVPPHRHGHGTDAAGPGSPRIVSPGHHTEVNR